MFVEITVAEEVLRTFSDRAFTVYVVWHKTLPPLLHSVFEFLDLGKHSLLRKKEHGQKKSQTLTNSQIATKQELTQRSREWLDFLILAFTVCGTATTIFFQH